MTTSNVAPMVCVPVEPTEAMLKAGIDRHWPQSIGSERLALLYRAMLSAAPAPQPVQREAAACDCPNSHKPRGMFHAPNCPWRTPAVQIAAPGDVEQRARELLQSTQREMGVTFFSPVSAQEQAAIRAISAALAARKGLTHWLVFMKP